MDNLHPNFVGESCPECAAYQKEIKRLKGTLGAECARQLLEAREENTELLNFLKELQRFAPSLSRLADDHLQYPVNCNKALAQIEVLITKHTKP
jgi:hypothetical protein